MFRGGCETANQCPPTSYRLYCACCVFIRLAGIVVSWKCANNYSFVTTKKSVFFSLFFDFQKKKIVLYCTSPLFPTPPPSPSPSPPPYHPPLNNMFRIEQIKKAFLSFFLHSDAVPQQVFPRCPSCLGESSAALLLLRAQFVDGDFAY